MKAWLSRSPDDPALPDDPNLIDPNDFIGWNPICDLNGDYTISLPDLDLFLYDWLWLACWKESRMARFDGIMESMMGGGGMMSMSSGLSIPAAPLAKAPPMTEEELLADTVLGIYVLKDFVDELLRQDYSEMDKAELLEVKKSLDDWLIELERRYLLENTGK